MSQIILLDNQPLTQHGLQILAKQADGSAEILIASSFEDLKGKLDSRKEIIIVMDYCLSGINHFKELEVLSSRCPFMRFLFVETSLKEDFVNIVASTLPEANIALKSNRWEDLLSAISSTITNRKFYCSEALEILIGNKPHKKQTNTDNPFDRLTPTEREVAQMLALGKSSKEIAEERCRSWYTVTTFRKNIFRKLGVNSIQELMRLAITHHFVDFNEYYI